MENIKNYFGYKSLITPQLVTGGDNTAYPDAYIDLKANNGGLFQKCMVVIQANLGNGNTCICKLLQANDASGTGNQAVASSRNNVTLTGNATATKVIGVIDFDAMDLYVANNSQMFVGVSCNVQKDNDSVSACLIQGDPRYIG